MRRANLFGLVFAMMVSGSFAARQGENGEALQKTIPLRVFYVGDRKTPREKDFVRFLEEHFAQVGKGDLDTFKVKDAGGFDVIILDYSGLKIERNTIISPRIPFGNKFSRPTVTIGAAGALVSGRLRLKTGYL